MIEWRAVEVEMAGWLFGSQAAFAAANEGHRQPTQPQ